MSVDPLKGSPKDPTENSHGVKRTDSKEEPKSEIPPEIKPTISAKPENASLEGRVSSVGSSCKRTVSPAKVLDEVQLSPKGPRFKMPEEFTAEEREFVECFETPDTGLQSHMDKVFGAKFEEFSDVFERDGVVILPSFFNEEQVAEMKGFFDSQIKRKPLNPFLQQASFNCAVDPSVDLSSSKAMSEAIANPTIIHLITRYMGQPITFANGRGYRLGPRPGLLYRAWDWHNDQKRKEVKVMILLSDVAEDGQAMQVIPGSHTKWWNMSSQKETKYSFDEAMALGSKTGEDAVVRKCTGKAGTIIFFDTNIVHRGYRNESKKRDVFTFNYLVDKPGAAVFPIGELHPDVVKAHSHDYVGSVARIVDTKEESTAGKLESLNVSLSDKDVVRELQDQMGDQPIQTTELDTGKKETAILYQEYQDTPKYEDIKPRFEGSSVGEFKEFLLKNHSVDFGPDLDLPVRMGNGDVDRDIQLVYYRDRGYNSPAVTRLVDDLQRIDFESLNEPHDISISKFTDMVREVQTYAQSGITDEDKEKDLTLTRIKKLAEDFEDSFKRADSVERVRSNLIYTYSMFAHLSVLLPRQSRQLSQLASTVLEDYAYIVMNDDLELQQAS